MCRYPHPLGTLVCVAGLLLAACDRDPDSIDDTRAPASHADHPGKGSNPARGQRDTTPTEPAGEPGDVASGNEASSIARNIRSSLQWKRYAAFEAELGQALELPKEELCNEFGEEPCIRGAHLPPRAGPNPFRAGLLESSAEPLVTTSKVVGRVVLSACIARIEKDRALGAKSALVFGGLDLDAPAPASDAAALRDIIHGLYRRFLARDAEPVELDTLAALARDEAGAPVSAGTFAASVCMVVGTQTEFLYF